MIPRVAICHALEDRIHLRAAAWEGRLQDLQDLKGMLESCSFIDLVEIRPVTGSLFVFGCDAQKLQEIDSLTFTRLPDFQDCKSLRIRVSRFVEETFKTLDGKLIKSSRGWLDLVSVLVLIVLFFAFKQVQRGMILPAGFTLLLVALKALR